MAEIKDILTDPELIREFLAETRELLVNVDNDLITLESDPGNEALLNRIFRSIHTLKGTSGFLGFNQIVALSHGTEDVLHMVRSGERSVDAGVMDSLFEATAVLKKMLKKIEDLDDSPVETQRLWQRFADIKAGNIGRSTETKTKSDSRRKQKDSQRKPKKVVKSKKKVESKTTVGKQSGKPTEVSKTRETTNTLHKTGIQKRRATQKKAGSGMKSPTRTKPAARKQSASNRKRSPVPLDKRSSAKQSLNRPVQRISKKHASRDLKSRVDSALDRVSAESGQACSIPAGPEVDARTVRVDVERLDDLMNLVGELVIERNKLIRAQRELAFQQNTEDYIQRVADIAESVNFLTNELQLGLLKARMMPVHRLFRKLPRMVRDLAVEKHKEVDLIISGGDTELDKQVMDQLMKPLVHILRNAVDHGIETPEERKQKGKSANGRIYLSARQEGNHILLSVKDDGRGLNIESIHSRALKRSLVSEKKLSRMSEWEVIQLIFEPGFSTAGSSGHTSGRGVGLDVVKTTVRRLNGLLDVKSEPDEGTEFIIKLPLTLAIMQALMVRVHEEVYAIPMATVVETSQIESQTLHRVEGRWSVRHRDGLLPLFRLEDLFRKGSDEHALPEKSVKDMDDTGVGGFVVHIGVAEKRFGIVVDGLLGQEDLVIKSLGETLGSLSGIVGGTITGDGRIRLIVDCGTLADRVRLSAGSSNVMTFSHSKRMEFESHD